MFSDKGFYAIFALLAFGAIIAMTAVLPFLTWMRFLIWLAVGFAIYFLYGIRRSRLSTDN